LLKGFYNIIGAPSGRLHCQLFIFGGRLFVNNGRTGTGISGSVPGLGSYSPLDVFTGRCLLLPIRHWSGAPVAHDQGAGQDPRRPNLLVKSGEKGEFLAGSKIPYNVLVSTGGTATTSIVFEQVGVNSILPPLSWKTAILP